MLKSLVSFWWNNLLYMCNVKSTAFYLDSEIRRWGKNFLLFYMWVVILFFFFSLSFYDLLGNVKITNPDTKSLFACEYLNQKGKVRQLVSCHLWFPSFMSFYNSSSFESLISFFLFLFFLPAELCLCTFLYRNRNFLFKFYFWPLGYRRQTLIPNPHHHFLKGATVKNHSGLHSCAQLSSGQSSGIWPVWAPADRLALWCTARLYQGCLEGSTRIKESRSNMCVRESI